MKKAILSPLLSALIFPGAGQINNRQYLKGSTIIATVLIAGIIFFIKVCRDIMKIVPLGGQDTMNAESINKLSAQILQQNEDIIKILALLFVILWIYGIVDAYVYGKKIDKKEGR
jgi:hypothetical protein